MENNEMINNEEIPEWAYLIAYEKWQGNTSNFTGKYIKRTYENIEGCESRVMREFAKYISQTMEPPVDPMEENLNKILTALYCLKDSPQLFNTMKGYKEALKVYKELHKNEE